MFLNNRRKFCNKESQNLYISGNVIQINKKEMCTEKQWVQKFELKISGKGVLGK